MTENGVFGGFSPNYEFEELCKKLIDRTSYLLYLSISMWAIS